MKKILLVGGAGFIGHNLALLLKKKNYQVTLLDSLKINNIKSKDKKNIYNKKLYNSILNNRLKIIKNNKIKFIEGDARDSKRSMKLFKKINPNIIIHLAAVSHANKSNKDPHTTFDNSLVTLENTLNFAKDAKCKIIYLSSSMVYGNFNKKTIKENDQCNPIGIYGNLKLAGEMMVKSYSNIFRFPYTIIRPSALYGERCVSRRVGQIFIENAIQNKPITLQGSKSEKLDFTYIEDLIKGIELCCRKKSAINQTFNLTFGRGRPISKLIQILSTQFPKLKIHYKTRDKFMPIRGTLSIKKAKKILGFKSNFPLEIGYLKYIKWYKNFYKNNMK